PDALPIWRRRGAELVGLRRAALAVVAGRRPAELGARAADREAEVVDARRAAGVGAVGAGVPLVVTGPRGGGQPTGRMVSRSACSAYPRRSSARSPRPR